MFATNLKGSLVTLAVTAGLLAVAGPASADNARGAFAPVGFAAVPEMDANANAFFRPEVDDEVLAYANYEPDVFW